MLEVKSMEVEDFQFATDLANTMNWNMALEDFEFNLRLEPGGCFVAFDGAKRIGIATCISFGRIGWFGNLIVAKEYRRKGVGSLLVRHAVEYLKMKGAQTIGLYAYENLIDFYSSLGFKQDETFSLLQIEALDCSIPTANLPSGKNMINEIEELDRKYFGADRARLLESIILDNGNLSYYYLEKGEVIGYVAATVYEKMAWIGPLICDSNKLEAAICLIKSVLSKLKGLSVYTVIPKKEIALADMLTELGFREEFSNCRMFNGEPVAKNCIYLAESLERG